MRRIGSQRSRAGQADGGGGPSRACTAAEGAPRGVEAYQPLDKEKGGGGGGRRSALCRHEEGLIPGMGGFDILKPIVASHTFQVFSFTFLIINVVLMCPPTADQTAAAHRGSAGMTSFFTGFFMLEILLRLFAGRPLRILRVRMESP